MGGGLIGQGYGDADIKTILGGNAVRVLSAIWPAESGRPTRPPQAASLPH
jgi:hypothetical protein